MAQLSKFAHALDDHEELFLARYRRMYAWALQLAEHNREHAEDLVHDAYIQFTYTCPDLDKIGNLDGYLYSMLRNLHLSQVRRTLRQQHRSLSIVDYDSAEIGLRAADPREQIPLQDQLRQVCQYACLRKQTSKAGSVLILRFMHGYYPREIALAMQSTRQAVEERLRVARNEARQYLENPKSLRFIREAPAEMAKVSQMGFARTSEELLNELRQTIFNSRQGNCPTSEQLEKLYRPDAAEGINHMTFGHIVSCPACLDEINRLLDLPLLCERFPTDTLGTDTQSKGGGGGGNDDGGTTGGASAGERQRCRRRAKDVFEHRPTELCISVNGYLMAAQRVSSELSEQTLSINVAEKIDFIEIFSEQEIRLLFVAIEELPPGGAYKRSTLVKLSDDRALEVVLSFSNPWPTLQVVYRDPLLNNEGTVQLDMPDEASAPAGPMLAIDPAKEEQGSQKQQHISRFLKYAARLLKGVAQLWRWFANPLFWLRPGTITALVSLLLIAALLLTRVHVPAISAAELLRRSTVSEEKIAGNSEVVLHRTINLEERHAKGGDLISRRRIEVWQSIARGVRLRRIYDEQRGLIAGEWTKTDGTSTVYQRGSAPQARTAPEMAAKAILETGELWRLDASARDFNALVGRPEAIRVEERSNTYVLDYRSHQGNDERVLLHHATLTLNKADLHAVEETLTIERDGEEREYRFIETGFEQSPAGTVAPSLFQPDPELLGASEQAKQAGDKRMEDTLSSALGHPSEAVASPELEIEVTYLLSQIKADLGEQVSMTRSARGALHVEALVETERRKEEILRALNPIINNPAVKVEINTVGEAFKREREEGSKPRDVTTREVEIRNNRIPADADLRSYFSARLTGGDAIDEEINRYARRLMNHSRQALLRASALERLVRRWSPEELRRLTPEAQSKWRSMIREHAQSCSREVTALQQGLRPIFNGSGESSGETAYESNPAQAADRLLRLSYANDEAVRSAFTISTDEQAAMTLKTTQFWRSLDAIKKLTAAIESAYR